MTEHTGLKCKLKSGGLLILRVLMGLGMAYHGYQKVFGGIMPRMAEGLTQMGMPAPTIMAWLAGLAELVGGLFIAIGLGTRISAFFVFVTMAVAFFWAHAKDPFQVKELAFLYGAVALSFVFTGGGRFSIDSLICCRKCSKSA
ncbi:MAG: DoxX family protein [Elusimicrobiota bacterium]